MRLVRLYKQRSWLEDYAAKAFSRKAELLEFQEGEEARLDVPPEDVKSFNWENFLARSPLYVVTS